MKRANSIYFFVGKENGLTFLVNKARNIFDFDEYYEKIHVSFIDQLCFHLKERFTFSKYLYIRSFFENFLRGMSISNILLHLFYCPRSFFSKNDCFICSRRYLKKELECPIKFFENENISSQIETEKEYDFKFFWDNEQQKNVINSNIKRCLSTFIIQDSRELLFLFFEIQGRYFANFFHSLSKVCLDTKEERYYFIKISNELFQDFFSYILRNVRLNYLNDLFDEIEFDHFKYLKIINKKYKEELKRRYES